MIRSSLAHPRRNVFVDQRFLKEITQAGTLRLYIIEGIMGSGKDTSHKRRCENSCCSGGMSHTLVCWSLRGWFASFSRLWNDL